MTILYCHLISFDYYCSRQVLKLSFEVNISCIYHFSSSLRYTASFLLCRHPHHYHYYSRFHLSFMYFINKYSSFSFNFKLLVFLTRVSLFVSSFYALTRVRHWTNSTNPQKEMKICKERNQLNPVKVSVNQQ